MCIEWVQVQKSSSQSDSLEGPVRLRNSGGSNSFEIVQPLHNESVVVSGVAHGDSSGNCRW